MILDYAYDLLSKKITDDLRIQDVRIGPFLSAVILSDGRCGFAATSDSKTGCCKKENRDFSEFTPMKITGEKVADLFTLSKDSYIISTLRNAVMNALSADEIYSGNHKVIENCDPIDLIDLSPDKTFTLVGAFQSYINRIHSSGNRLYVLEMNENALSDDQKQFYVPGEDYMKVIPLSDVVIITGLSLVNRTLDNILSAIPEKAITVVAGPSASVVPDILFNHNVDIIGATVITDPDRLLELACQGGAGYHLFRYCAKKICIVRSSER